MVRSVPHSEPARDLTTRCVSHIPHTRHSEPVRDLTNRCVSHIPTPVTRDATTSSVTLHPTWNMATWCASDSWFLSRSHSRCSLSCSDSSSWYLSARPDAHGDRLHGSVTEKVRHPVQLTDY